MDSYIHINGFIYTHNTNNNIIKYNNYILLYNLI